MNEVKRPKKTLTYFYCIAALLLVLFNLLLLLGMKAEWDKLLMNVLVVAFNYFASSLVIFKKR